MARGGQREGSGRPKGEGTKIVRVPLGCLARVEAIIQIYKEKQKGNTEFKIKGHSPFVESKYNRNYDDKNKEVKEIAQDEMTLPLGKRLNFSEIKTISATGYQNLSRKDKRIIKSKVKKGKCKII